MVISFQIFFVKNVGEGDQLLQKNIFWKFWLFKFFIFRRTARFKLLVGLTVTLFCGKKILFPLDECKVSCPAWSKNLWRYLLLAAHSLRFIELIHTYQYRFSLRTYFLPFFIDCTNVYILLPFLLCISFSMSGDFVWRRKPMETQVTCTYILINMIFSFLPCFTYCKLKSNYS